MSIRTVDEKILQHNFYIQYM